MSVAAAALTTIAGSLAAWANTTSQAQVKWEGIAHQRRDVFDRLRNGASYDPKRLEDLDREQLAAPKPAMLPGMFQRVKEQVEQEDMVKAEYLPPGQGTSSLWGSPAPSPQGSRNGGALHVKDNRNGEKRAA
ncbi:hypothetical protein ACFUJR_23145 [Streptomyces sp. NPDC057271]|uniref:hypothetical protein n=1 Tax=unclassified Streptomyces TaxID=2593676 RepID=UPI00363EE5C6